MFLASFQPRLFPDAAPRAPLTFPFFSPTTYFHSLAPVGFDQLDHTVRVLFLE